MERDARVRVGIHRGRFRLAAETARVRGLTRRSGAVVTFLGVAREMTGERGVVRLHFETYGPMALPLLRELAAEALERFGLHGVTILHRVGDIEPGDEIVLIAVAAEGRAAAFEGARWCIDTLKARIPIWKKEVYADGQAWVQQTP